MRRTARRSLQSRGIESRIAYVSRTSGGLIAALISGLAIAPLSRTAIPAGCRELTEEDGFGIIDMTNVVLRTRRGNRSATVDAMADAIRRAFRGTAEKEKGRSAIHDDRWMIYDPGYLLGRWAPYARTHGSGQGQSP